MWDNLLALSFAFLYTAACFRVGWVIARRASTWFARWWAARSARRYGVALMPNDAAAAALAEKKSIILLKEWLAPHQLAEFERTGQFRVRGSSTQRPYYVCSRSSYNVWDLGEHYYCFGPSGVPLGDVMLAQKIALENFETEALTIANCIRKRDGGTHECTI